MHSTRRKKRRGQWPLIKMGLCQWCNFPFPSLFLIRFVMGRENGEQKRRGKSWFVNPHSSHYPQRESCYGRCQMRNDIPRCLKRVRFPMPPAKYQDLMLKLSLKRRKNYAWKKKNWIPLEIGGKIEKNESERDVGEIVPGDTMTTERNTAHSREKSTWKGRWFPRGRFRESSAAEETNSRKRNIQDAYRCRIIYISNLRLEFI